MREIGIVVGDWKYLSFSFEVIWRIVEEIVREKLVLIKESNLKELKIDGRCVLIEIEFSESLFD
jgi:hypothetical protein